MVAAFYSLLEFAELPGDEPKAHLRSATVAAVHGHAVQLLCEVASR